jgi:hypothetical protein
LGERTMAVVVMMRAAGVQVNSKGRGSDDKDSGGSDDKDGEGSDDAGDSRQGLW